MRAFLTFIAVVLVLLVGAVLLLPMFVSADLVKREVESAVQEATGRELTIAGDVSITAWPALGATIGEVTFANAPGATEPQMATMQELRAELAIMPLLSGEIRVDQFVLLEPVIHLEVARDGTPNWQFEGAPAPAEAPAGEDVPGDGQTPGGMAPTEVVLADIRVENGRVTYRNAQTGDAHEFSDVDMSVSLPGLDEQMTLDGALTWNAERVNVDVAVDQPRAVIEGGTTPATIKVASNPLNVDYAGSITMGEGLSTDGSVSLDVPSVRNLAAWTGNPMPDGGGFGPLSLSGDVSSRPDRYAFSNAQISFDGTSGTGNMTVLTSGARPKITGALSVDQIDTNVYAGQGDTGWSTDTIDLSGLKAVDADLDLSADEIIFGNIVIGQSALDLGIDNGLMTAVLNKLALYGGAGSGRLTLNGRNATPALAGDFSLSGLAIEPFLKAAMDFDTLRGTGQFNIDVTTTGSSQAQMVQNLNGNGGIDFRNGAIKGINLASIIRTALTNPISGWSSASSQDTDFSELTGSFTITNGVLSNDNLNMLGPLLRLTGAGSTSIPQRTINYRLKPKLVASLEGQGGQGDLAGLNVPVIVTGTWSNPKFAPDLGAVLENPGEALKSLENIEKLQPKDVIRGLLGQDSGGSSSGGSGAQPEQQKQEKPKPEDLIRGLLGR